MTKHFFFPLLLTLLLLLLLNMSRHVADLENATIQDSSMKTYELYCVNWDYVKSQIEEAQSKKMGVGACASTDSIRRVLSQV